MSKVVFFATVKDKRRCGRLLEVSKVVEEILSWVKDQYCVEGPYCGEDEVSSCVEEARCVEA